MRHVAIDMRVAASAADAYRTLSDFERYPQLSDAVRSVTVSRVDDRTTVSTWEVAFRSGLLRWTEEDRFDAAALQIEFRQLEGDVAVFDGRWTCSGDGDAARIRFTARLDLGIPTLADALEPIAVRTLVDNTVAIVGGLFGGVETVGVDDNAAVAAG